MKKLFVLTIIMFSILIPNKGYSKIPRDQWDNKFTLFLDIGKLSVEPAINMGISYNLFERFSVKFKYSITLPQGSSDTLSNHFSLLFNNFFHYGKFFISPEYGFNYGRLKEDVPNETQHIKGIFAQFGLILGVRTYGGGEFHLTFGGYNFLFGDSKGTIGDFLGLYWSLGFAYSFLSPKYTKEEKEKLKAKYEIEFLNYYKNVDKRKPNSKSSKINKKLIYRVPQRFRSIWDNKFTILVSSGMGTPTGFYGGQFVYDIKKSISIEAGLGRGLESTQYSLMGKYRFILKKEIYIQLGLGASYGRVKELILGGNDRRDNEVFGVEHGFMLNLEYNFGVRSKSGLVFQLKFGAYFLTNYKDTTCFENCYHTSAGGSVFYTRVNDADMNKVMPYIGIDFGLNL